MCIKNLPKTVPWNHPNPPKMEAGGTPGPLQNTILDKNVFGSESFGPVPPCGDQKGTQNEVRNRLKSNKKFNVSYTVLEDASGTLFETKKASQNMSRSKQKTSLKDITFCIIFFHKFLSKTELKPIRAQYDKSHLLLLFTVVLSTSLSGNDYQNLSLQAFKT